VQFGSSRQLNGETSGEQARFGLTAHAGHCAAIQNRRFPVSPIDALIDIKIRCGCAA